MVRLYIDQEEWYPVFELKQNEESDFLSDIPQEVCDRYAKVVEEFKAVQKILGEISRETSALQHIKDYLKNIGSDVTPTKIVCINNSDEELYNHFNVVLKDSYYDLSLEETQEMLRARVFKYPSHFKLHFINEVTFNTCQGLSWYKGRQILEL